MCLLLLSIIPGRFQRDIPVGGTDPANSATLDKAMTVKPETAGIRGDGCAGQWLGTLEEGREPVCRGEGLTFL